MKSLNAWKLNSTLINNTCIKEKVSKEIIKHIIFNESTMHQNIWYATKPILKVKLIALMFILEKKGLKSIF